MKSPQSKPKMNPKKKWLVGAGIFVVVYIISLFTPFINAFTLYPVYTLKCMRLPIAASEFTTSYYLPGDKAYKIHPFIDHYFCTEKEAQDAYFHYYNYTD